MNALQMPYEKKIIKAIRIKYAEYNILTYAYRPTLDFIDVDGKYLKHIKRIIWKLKNIVFYFIDYHGPLLVHIQGLNLPYCYRQPGKYHSLHGSLRQIRTHALCSKTNSTVRACGISLVRMTTKPAKDHSDSKIQLSSLIELTSALWQ